MALKWLRRALGSLEGSGERAPRRSWEEPLDVRAERHAALDMAILNMVVGTREETGDQPDTLRGDYLEFGVFEGAAFMHAHHRAREHMPWMRFFAFDSFAGLPPPVGVDAGGEFVAGQFACSEARFERNLREAGVDRSRVVVVPGWFDEVLGGEAGSALKKRHRLKVCSIAYIDADLYASTVPVMAFLTDLVRRGTILLFDDWYCFRGDPKRGVQRAVGEWLADNPRIKLAPWHPFCHHGQSFIVQVDDG